MNRIVKFGIFWNENLITDTKPSPSVFLVGVNKFHNCIGWPDLKRKPACGKYLFLLMAFGYFIVRVVSVRALLPLICDISFTHPDGYSSC